MVDSNKTAFRIKKFRSGRWKGGQVRCPLSMVPHHARLSLRVVRLSRGIFCGPPSLSNLQGCRRLFICWAEVARHTHTSYVWGF